MTGTEILFIALGAIALLVGIGMLTAGIRGKAGETPRHTILLIAGMMATAFGLLLVAFAVTAATAGPPASGATS